MIELIIACAALVVAAAALLRAYVPPQVRAVRELQVRVGDLEQSWEDLAGRFTSRQRKDGMEKARAAHTEAKARRTAIEEHAAAILASAQQTQPQALSAADLKAQLRAEHLAKKLN